MTELATTQPTTPPVAPASSDPTGGRLVAWAKSLQAAKQIGDALCGTTFVPAHFRGKPEDAAAAILFGDELGLTPTQALRSVYVIGGSPALYARTMVAIVLHHGHSVETVEKTDAKVTVRGRRRGSNHTVEESWTTARAQKAGYTSNKKYQSDPQSMLYARAAADVCRQIAPDALAGLPFTVEELEQEIPAATVTVTRTPEAPAGKRTAKRAALPAASAPEEPGFDEPPADEPSSTEQTDAEQPHPPADERQQPKPPSGKPAKPITAAQLKMLHACLNKAGIADRDLALAFYADTVGRDVASSKDLTSDEASRVIDALLNMGAGEAADDDGGAEQ